MQRALDDLASAWRSLASQRGLTTAAVLTLAVGVSAGTVGFVTLRIATQQHTAVADPGRVARVWRVDPLLGNDRGNLTLSRLRELQPAVQSVELAGFTSGEAALSHGSATVPLGVQRVTGRYLELLGVRPELGRTLQDVPEEAGLMLSFELWQRLFHGDAAVLGERLEVDGEERPIVGVVPAGFGFPATGTDLWMALPPTSAPIEVSVVARLAPSATWQVARLELNAAFGRSVGARPGERAEELRVVTVAEEAAKKSRLGLVAVLGPGLLLLTIACVNAGLLMLARATTRAREIAVRSALGATRLRIVRQLLAEGGLIALATAPIAALLALWGLSVVRVALAALSPEAAARIGVGADLGLGVFGLSAATPLLFALVPALHAARGDMIAALGRGAHRPTLSFGRYRSSDLLVALEMALATVLLVWSGLFVRFLWELENRVPATAPERLIVATPPGPDAFGGRRGSLQQLLETVSALPGIGLAAAADRLPVTDGRGRGTAALSPRPDAHDAATPVQLFRTTASGLRVLGRRIGRGRGFTGADRTGVCVVSERVARRLWPEADPVGRRVYAIGGKGDAGMPLEVVGVLSDVLPESPAELDAPAVYVLDPDLSTGVLLLRSAVDASGILDGVRSALPTSDRLEPWVVETLAQKVRRGLRGPGFMAGFIGAFGAVSLLLAGLGAHGVVRQAVRSRFHEIGVRIAVGASRDSIARLVLHHALSLVGVGVVIGGALTLVTTRIAWSTLVAVSSGDPWTFLAVAAPLVLVSVAACLGPLRDASRLDPLAVLRQE